MTSIGLDQKWIDYLKQSPETVMGYHEVVVQTSDGRELFGIAMNCERLVVRSKISVSDIKEIKCFDINE